MKASDPPLKIEQFPDFKHNAATSAVTLGLLSYITPMTPIGVVTLLIVKLFGLRHVSRTLPTGSLNFAISFIECLIPSILFLFKISLSTKCFLLTFFTSAYAGGHITKAQKEQTIQCLGHYSATAVLPADSIEVENLETVSYTHLTLPTTPYV